MTDEQRKRIHDITYSTDDRMELAERIVALEEEIDKQKFKFEVLKAHGIEIVDAVGGGHEIYDTRKREVNRLEYENDKLRESVRNLLTCAKHEECEESCPHYEPMYTDYGYEKNGSTVVESEYLGCCAVGLENCNSMLFDTDEYLRELGIEVPE